MKRNINFTLLFYLFACPLLAQQNSIPGTIALHNSKYRTNTLQFVPGASVRADSASPTTSDASGRFNLQFRGKESGLQARLTIEKTGLEVVNQRDLSSVTIGRETPFKVAMAPPEQLIQAQVELLEISTKTLTRRHDELIANLRTEGKKRLQTIALLEKELNTEISDWQEAEKLLDERLQRLKQELPATMWTLARVNLDEATSQYIEAYELIREGKVSEALSQLRNGNWATKANKILKEFKRFEKSDSTNRLAADKIQEAVEESIGLFLLEADAYKLQFEYQNSQKSTQAALQLLEQTGNSKSLLMADVLDQMAITASFEGNYRPTIDLCTRSLAIKKTFLDEQDFELALAHLRLAASHLGCGELEKAKQEITQGIFIAGVFYLMESPPILPFLTTKSSIERELGNFEQAQRDLKMAMEIESEAYGPDEPSRSQTLLLLSNMQVLTGKWDSAEASIREAIRIYEINFPEGSPEMAECHSNLAQVLLGQGRLNDAYAHQMMAAELFEKYLPPYSTFRILSQNNLAQYLISLEKPKAALELLQGILEEEDKGHLTIALTHRWLILNNLGAAFTQLGQPRKAIGYLNEALYIQKKLTDGRHPNTVKVLLNLATTQIDLGAYDSARTYLDHSLKLCDTLPHSSDHDCAKAHQVSGFFFYQTEQFEAAIQSFTQAWETFQKMYGQNHYLTVGAERELASILYAREHYPEAIEHLKKVLEAYESQPFELTNSIAETHHVLGIAYGKMGLSEIALGHLQQAINLSWEAPEIDSTSLAKVYLDLAHTYTQEAVYFLAEIAMDQAEEILTQMIPMDTNAVIYAYLSKGNILADAGKSEEGLEFQEKALFLSENLSTINPRDISVSYNNLSFRYRQLAAYESALRNSEKAISAFLNSPASIRSKPWLITLYNNRVHMLSDVGMIDSALAYQKKALLLERQVRSKGDPIFEEYKTAFFVLFDEKFPYHYRNPLSEEEQLKQDLIQYSYMLDLFPEDSESYQNLGSSYFQAGKYKKAIRWYKKGVEYDTNSAYCHLKIGTTYLEMGKPEKAREAFSEGSEAGPDDPKANLGWAIYWTSVRQYDMAIDNIQKALEQGLHTIWIEGEKGLVSLKAFDRFNRLMEQYDDQE